MASRPLPADNHHTAIFIAGEPVVFDPAGALWWPRAAVLVVADLHLEKGSSLAGRGHLLPPYDSAATLAALSALIDRYRPARVVALGDSFHDCGGPERLSEPDRDCLNRLSGRCDWIWIAGNHDPEIGDYVGGSQIAELALSPFVFRHAPEPGEAPGEVAGHLHPAAKLAGRGRNLRRRCFATDGARVIMPAFGAYTGGLNVLDPAFDGLFGRDFHVWMIGADAVHPVARARLRPD